MSRDFVDFVFSTGANSFEPLLERLGFKRAAFPLQKKDLPNLKTVKSCSFKLVDPLKEKDFENAIRKASREFDYVLAFGGSIDLNKRLVRCKGLSVLVNPCDYNSVNVDVQTITMAKENNVRFGLAFTQALNQGPFKRALLLSKYNFLFSILKRERFHPVIFSGASNPVELRNPYDLAALLETLGLSNDEALAGVALEKVN